MKDKLISYNKRDNTVVVAVPQIDRIYRTVSESIIVTASKQTIRNSISFKNTGTVNATVKGQPILAGDPMLSFGAELPAEDITNYEIIFDNVAGTRKIDIIETHIVSFRTVILSVPIVEKPENLNF